MPAPNYRFEKRQRELVQQKKKEEKRLKKEARKATEGLPPDGEMTAGEKALAEGKAPTV